MQDHRADCPETRLPGARLDSPQTVQATTNRALARAGYTILGDCLQHTLDVISRLQGQAAGTLREAAAEIERLRADNERLREVLRNVASRAHAGLAR